MGAIWSSFVSLLELALIWFSSITGNVALGIILFTIAARLVILPLTLSSIRSSRQIQELQPQIKELQRKYGKDPQKLNEETLKLYRQYKINPLGGCLPLLLQLPIFFGVYQAVYHLFGGEAGRQYLSAGAAARLEDPAIAAIFAQKLFGVIEVGGVTFGPKGFAGPAYLILPVLSIVLQLVQTLMATPRVQDPQQKAMTQMMMFMPLVFGYIAFTFPQGAVLYWVVSSVVGIVQQYFTTGWGSLANYLTFLPPDGKPATPSPSASAPAGGEAIGATASAAPRADFWSVMRPLVEMSEPTTESATPAASQPAPDEAASASGRQPVAQPANLRKPRRRK